MFSDDNLYATVKCRSNADAAFYGRWLLRAAEAEKLLLNLRNSNIEPTSAIDRIDSCCFLNFEITALNVVAEIIEHQEVLVPMTSYEAELLSILVSLKFLQLADNSYVLTLPKAIKTSGIRKAIEALAKTEDHGYMLHPCHLLACRKFPRQGTISSVLAASW